MATKSFRDFVSEQKTVEIEKEGETAKVPKQAVLYLLKRGTQYECRDCSMFIKEKERCTIHGKNDVIRAHGSCGFFIKGEPHGDKAMGLVSKQQSGYVENPAEVGFSCKRCSYFDPAGDCAKVDKNSKGDTPGEIHPDACCNNWEAHPTRSKKEFK